VLTSAGLAAMTVGAVIYVNEMYPAAVRGKFQAYAIVICGTPATNLIASAVVPLNDWSWRLVCLWGSLGILLVLFSKRLEESPRRHESRGDHAEADRILREIEESVAAEKGPLAEPLPAVPETPVTRAPLRLLLHKKYLYPTLLLTVLWVTQTIGFFGFSSRAPTLLAKEGFSVEKSVF
jgi:putative MFS transporter